MSANFENYKVHLIGGPGHGMEFDKEYSGPAERVFNYDELEGSTGKHFRHEYRLTKVTNNRLEYTWVWKDNDAMPPLKTPTFPSDPMTAIKELDQNISETVESILVRINTHDRQIEQLTKAVNSLVENSLFGKPAVVTNAQVEKIRRAKVDTSPGSSGMTFDETESRRPTEITFTAAEVYELQQIVYWAESNALDKALDLNISWGASFDLMDEWHKKRPPMLNPAAKKKLNMIKDPS